MAVHSWKSWDIVSEEQLGDTGWGLGMLDQVLIFTPRNYTRTYFLYTQVCRGSIFSVSVKA